MSRKGLMIVLAILILTLLIQCGPEVDFSAPTLEITSHSNGEYVKGIIIIKGTASDNGSIEKVEVSEDGGEFFSTSMGGNEWSHAIDTRDLEDGNLTLSVRAVDNADLMNYQFLSLLVDNTAPSNIDIDRPVDNDDLNGVVMVNGTAFDEISIEKIEVKIGDADTYHLANGTNNWTYNFDSTTFTDGNYTLSAKATDFSGNATIETVSVNIDQNSDKPSGSIATPIENSSVTGYTIIAGSASDDDGVSLVQVSIDGGAYEDATGTYNWNYEWDTFAESNSTHEITVLIHDINTPAATSVIGPLTVIVNNSGTGIPPTLDITSPADGAYVKDTITIEGTASDDVALSSVQININNTGYVNVDTPIGDINTSGDWSYDFDTSSYEGNVSIIVRANDGDLNNYEFLTLVADNESPEIIITSHADNDKVNNPTLVVYGTVSDNISIQSVEVTIDGGTTTYKAAGLPNWTANVPIDSLADESYFDITVVATDFVGNTTLFTVSNVQKLMSTDKPIATFINPVQDQKISGIVSVTGTAIDDDAVGYVQIDFDSAGSWQTITGEAVWNYSWKTTDTTQGPHTISIRVYDIYGTVGDDLTIDVIVDQTIPSLSIDDPLPGAYIKGSLVVNGLASDNHEIDKVEVSLDGGLSYSNDNPNYPITYDSGTDVWFFPLDTTVQYLNNDGTHTIYLRAIDITGLIGVTSVIVNVDNASPSIVMNSPIDNEMISGIYPMSGTASDSIGIEKVRIQLGSIPWVDAAGTTVWNYDYDTTGIPNGTYTVKAEVTDFSSNKATSADRTVIIDQNMPTVDSINIEDGDYLYGSAFTISGTVEDLDGDFNVGGENDLDKVEISVDSGAYALIGTDGGTYTETGTDPASASWSFDLNTTAYSNGAHNINIRVTDDEGGYTILTKSIVIDNVLPVISIEAPVSGQKIGTSSLITGPISDAHSGILSLTITIDDLTGSEQIVEDITASIQNGYWSYLWNTTNFTLDQNQGITVEAIDNATNTNSAYVEVTKTSDVPSVNFTSHSNGDYIKETITLEGTAEAVGATNSVQSVEIQIDGGTKVLATPTSGWDTWEFEINTISLGLTDGTHVILATVTDNTSPTPLTSTVGINLIVDNTAPVITITSPVEFDLVHGIVNITGIVTDNYEVDTVTIDITDDQAANFVHGASITDDDYLCQWDSSEITYRAGEDIKIKPIAQDKAGNIGYINNGGNDFIFVDVQPYIDTLSEYSAVIGDSITLFGSNYSNIASYETAIFFDNNGSMEETSIDAYGDTGTIAVIVPAKATSGYMYVTTNGVQSNQVWINIWDVDEVVTTVNGNPVTVYYSDMVMYDDNNIYACYATDSGLYSDKYMYFRKYTNGDWATPVQVVHKNYGSFYLTYNSIALGGATNSNVYIVSFVENEYEIELFTSTNGGASFDAGDRQGRTVIDGSAGSNWYEYTNIAVHYDSGTGEDIIYISYYDVSNESLGLAKSTDSGDNWTIETVDSSSNVGEYNAIDLDSSGNPHISYFDFDNKRLKYAYWDGSAWVITIADSVYVGEFSDLAIGNNGTNDVAHISYYDGLSGNTKYASGVLDGSLSFTAEVAYNVGVTGWYSDMALDSDGDPFVASYSFSNNCQLYIEKDAGVWQEPVQVPGLTSNLDFISIVLDSTDLVNIGYLLNKGIAMGRYIP